jgi:2-dehydro-3-deoxy-D-gluconate 5-dehydrogenase
MMLDQFRLDGQTALVTGCRRGIGMTLAEALAEAGADIIGVSASLKESGEEVAQRVTKLGRRFTGFKCDLSNRQSLYDFIGKITGTPIDILINNAGTIRRAPAAEYSDADWDKVVELNLSAQFILTREIGKPMLARGRGKIIFIASLLAFQGGITVPAYSASKGGVAQLTMALSNEWAGKGVNVNAIAPGYIETDNTAALRADAARAKTILDRIPAGRWGRPEDLKGAAVFLASRASVYVNGTILTVVGGWMGR